MPKYRHTGSWVNYFPHAPGYSEDEPLRLEPGGTVELDSEYVHPLLDRLDVPRKPAAKKAAAKKATGKTPTPEPDAEPPADAETEPDDTAEDTP